MHTCTHGERERTHILFLYSGVVETNPWIVHHTCAGLALHIETTSQATRRKLWLEQPKRWKRPLLCQASMRRAMDRSLEDRLQLQLGQTRALQASGLAGKIWPIGILACLLLLGLCCCLVTLATVQLMLWPIIFLTAFRTVSGCMACVLAPFA